MNQEQVKTTLLTLKSDVEDFSVILSGKKSSKVNGLYKPATHEIIIHNRNMIDDNGIIYTAIHEFAHHIQFSQTLSLINARYHTTQFWDIFHSLLFQAEKLGIYQNIFYTSEEFIALTERIRIEFIAVHGSLIKELGIVLLQAHKLCDKYKASFDDYVDRVLKIRHRDARFYIKLSNMDINPALGYENMKSLSRIKDEELRKNAEQDMIEDYSPDMIRAKYNNKPQPDDPLKVLHQEKERLEKTIKSLKNRLQMIEQKIIEIKGSVN